MLSGNVAVPALRRFCFVSFGYMVELAAAGWGRSSVSTGVGRCRTISTNAIPLPLAFEGGICCGSYRILR